jgi:endonuclease-3
MNRAEWVADKLLEQYGRIEWHVEEDPVETLVGTILSQNTSDRNSHSAYKSLLRKYENWESILNAPENEIAETIRAGGLPNIKARRIKKSLGKIKEINSGIIGLDFLEKMGKDEAREFLTSLEGVGPKTAACVLCFSFGMPILPVDTHVYRVSRRLGLIGQKTSVTKAHELLESMVPESKIYQFHVGLIMHGRDVCKSRKPLCEACILRSRCDFYKIKKKGRKK